MADSPAMAGSPDSASDTSMPWTVRWGSRSRSEPDGLGADGFLPGLRGRSDPPPFLLKNEKTTIDSGLAAERPKLGLIAAKYKSRRYLFHPAALRGVIPAGLAAPGPP